MVMLAIMVPEWPDSDSAWTSFKLWLAMKILKYILKQIRGQLYSQVVEFLTG